MGGEETTEGERERDREGRREGDKILGKWVQQCGALIRIQHPCSNSQLPPL